MPQPIPRGQLWKVAGPQESEIIAKKHRTADDMARKVARIFAGLASGTVETDPLPVSFAIDDGTAKDIMQEGVIQKMAHSLLRQHVEQIAGIELGEPTDEDVDCIDGMPARFTAGNWIVRQTVHRYDVPADVREYLDRVTPAGRQPLPPDGQIYSIVYNFDPASSTAPILGE